MSTRPRHRVRTVEWLMERDGPHCRYCGILPDAFGWVDRGKLAAPVVYVHGFDIDHVVPYSKGGSKGLANLVLACRPCNTKKWNREAPPMRPRYPFRLGPVEHSA